MALISYSATSERPDGGLQSYWGGAILYNSNAEKIKDLVTVEDALRRYHALGRHKGRTSCPVHGGKGDNFSYKDRVWHCFVCGEGGDVITLVQKIFDIDFASAISKLSEDFGIRLDKESKEDIQKRKVERERLQALEAARKACYSKAWSDICSYRRWLSQRPQSACRDAQLEDIDRQLDRMDLTGEAPDYDVRAMLRCLYFKLMEEKDVNNSDAGLRSGSNAGVDGRRL